MASNEGKSRQRNGKARQRARAVFTVLTFLVLLALLLAPTWVTSGSSGTPSANDQDAFDASASDDAIADADLGGVVPGDATTSNGSSSADDQARGDRGQRSLLAIGDLFADSLDDTDGSAVVPGLGMPAPMLTQSFSTGGSGPFNSGFSFDLGPASPLAEIGNTDNGNGASSGPGGFGGGSPMPSPSGSAGGGQASGGGSSGQAPSSGGNAGSPANGDTSGGGDSTSAPGNGGDSPSQPGNGGDSGSHPGNGGGVNTPGGGNNQGGGPGGNSGSNPSVGFVPANEITGDPNDTTPIPVVSDDGPGLLPGPTTPGIPTGDGPAAPAAVPEPATLVLLGTGLIAVARRFRRVATTS